MRTHYNNERKRTMRGLINRSYLSVLITSLLQSVTTIYISTLEQEKQEVIDTHHEPMQLLSKSVVTEISLLHYVI